MKKFTKTIIMMLVMTMLLGINGITVDAFSDAGLDKINIFCTCDKTGEWGYVAKDMYNVVHLTKTGPYKIPQRNGEIKTTYAVHYDCTLTEWINTHDESDWPWFVVKGSDGVPFYYTETSMNYKQPGADYNFWYVWNRVCYDEATGRWAFALEDREVPLSEQPVADEGTYLLGWMRRAPDKYGKYGKYTQEGITQETKDRIAAGEIINGKAENPDPEDLVVPEGVYDEDDKPIGIGKLIDGEYYAPEDCMLVDGEWVLKPGVEPFKPLTDEEIQAILDQYKKEEEEAKEAAEKAEAERRNEEINTLGATVTLKTDCFKTKMSKGQYVNQKPLPTSVKVGGKTLKRNRDYTVSYERYNKMRYDWIATNAIESEGDYRMVITGKNGYDGVYKKRLYVTSDKTIKAMSSAAVKVNKMSYTGEPITSGIIKSVKSGRHTLTEGTDYTVTYRNNTDSGTAQVILTAIEGSGFLGTKTVNFTITGNKMNKVKVSGISSIVYNPETDLVQDMSNVSLTFDGTKLNEGTDFTVTHTNNTKAGTAKITFTGKGLYNGTLTKAFKITKAPVSADMLDDESKNIELTYTGKALKPEVTIRHAYTTLKNGETTLKKGTDYTLAYKNNKNISTDLKPAQIVVKGKGNYTGSFKVDFKIVDHNSQNAETVKSKNVKPDTQKDGAETDEPATDETAEDESVTDESTEDNATTDETATDESTEDNTSTDETATDESTEDNTSTDETTTGENTGDSTTTDKTTTDKTTEDNTSSDEPATDETTGDNPTADGPVTDETTGDNITTDESATDESTTDSTTTDETAADETTTDEPTENNPVTNEQTADSPTIDTPTEYGLVTDKPAIDESVENDLDFFLAQ